jgi:hypothetical protein
MPISMVFHNAAKLTCKMRSIHSKGRNRENALLVHLLRELASRPAPIPVTRLWTRCTRLKIRELQMQTFH